MPPIGVRRPIGVFMPPIGVRKPMGVFMPPMGVIKPIGVIIPPPVGEFIPLTEFPCADLYRASWRTLSGTALSFEFFFGFTFKCSWDSGIASHSSFDTDE